LNLKRSTAQTAKAMYRNELSERFGWWHVIAWPIGQLLVIQAPVNYVTTSWRGSQSGLT